jgi:hypothetical protein
MRQLLMIAVLAAATASAAPAPTRFFFRDPGAVKISLDETATGCHMNGVLLHPVEKPQARVVWFSERVCGLKTQPVSLVSGEITAPDNIIHKGQQLHAQPVNVQIVQAGTL